MPEQQLDRIDDDKNTVVDEPQIVEIGSVTEAGGYASNAINSSQFN